jgi:hypothetical protein
MTEGNKHTKKKRVKKRNEKERRLKEEMGERMKYRSHD